MGTEKQLYCNTLSGLPAPSLTCLRIFPTQQIEWPVKTRVSCITLLFKTLQWLHISLRIKASIVITVYKFPWGLITWPLSDFTASLLALLGHAALWYHLYSCLRAFELAPLSAWNALPTDILNACFLTFLRSLSKCHLIGMICSGHFYKMATAPPHFISILIIAI